MQLLSIEDSIMHMDNVRIIIMQISFIQSAIPNSILITFPHTQRIKKLRERANGVNYIWFDIQIYRELKDSPLPSKKKKKRYSPLHVVVTEPQAKCTDKKNLVMTWQLWERSNTKLNVVSLSLNVTHSYLYNSHI